MQVIPIVALPSQSVSVSLAQQSCQINIYQKSTGLFLDLYLNEALVVGGVLCQNLNRIVRSGYLGFIGDLAFSDQQGTDDPIYTGLGSRFILLYLEAGEVPAG